MSTRYAIYIVPYHEDLFLQASRWLGWDCVAVEALPPPSEEEAANPTGLDIGIERGFEARGTWLHGQVRGSRTARLKSFIFMNFGRDQNYSHFWSSHQLDRRQHL